MIENNRLDGIEEIKLPFSYTAERYKIGPADGVINYVDRSGNLKYKNDVLGIYAMAPTQNVKKYGWGKPGERKYLEVGVYGDDRKGRFALFSNDNSADKIPLLQGCDILNILNINNPEKYNNKRCYISIDKTEFMTTFIIENGELLKILPYTLLANGFAKNRVNATDSISKICDPYNNFIDISDNKYRGVRSCKFSSRFLVCEKIIAKFQWKTVFVDKITGEEIVPQISDNDVKYSFESGITGWNDSLNIGYITNNIDGDWKLYIVRPDGRVEQTSCSDEEYEEDEDTETANSELGGNEYYLDSIFIVNLETGDIRDRDDNTPQGNLMDSDWYGNEK